MLCEKCGKNNATTHIKTVVNGAKTGISFKKKHMNSELSQTIWFYEALPRIDFETKVDWHEKNQILKVSFPVDINTDKATYEVQFGSIERPTHYNTSWDYSKFEVMGHKWVDVSDAGYGAKNWVRREVTQAEEEAKYRAMIRRLISSAVFAVPMRVRGDS